MSWNNATKAALCAAALLLSQFSSAAMVYVGAFEGANDQLDPDGYNTSLDELLGIDPLYQLARVDWDDNPDTYTNPQSDGGLTVTGTLFNVPDDPTEAIGGTFAYTGEGTLDYVAFKTDGWLIVFEMTEGTTSGDWSMAGFDFEAAPEGCCTNQNGNYQGLSHLSAYTLEDIVPDPIPLPAAAWLFGSALLGLGVVKRRKA